jgi:hypothetical protein
LAKFEIVVTFKIILTLNVTAIIIKAILALGNGAFLLKTAIADGACKSP